MGRTLTLEEMKAKVAAWDDSIEVLNEEYKGSRDKVLCRCKKDGYEWSSILLNVTKRRCARCSGHERLTIDEIRRRLKELNPMIQILTDVYVNPKGKLRCKCLLDDFEWWTSWRTLSENRGCPRCSGTRYDINTVKEKIAIIDPTIEILSTVYVNAATNLDCRCKIDGHLWKATFNSLSRGKGCRQCWIRNTSGENSKFWGGGVTILYKYLRLSARRWRKDSMIACGYRCGITGGVFDDVHHLYGFDLICKDTMDRCNLPVYQDISEYTQEELKLLDDTCEQIHYEHGLGICLEKNIHDLFHSEYGYGGNLPEQFEKFLKEKEMVRIA